MSAHFSPGVAKEPSVKLSPRVAKDKTIEEAEVNDGNAGDMQAGINHSAVSGTNSETKLGVPAIPKGATPSELDQILKTQKKEEELLEEQHELLQKKLLHDYDGYIRDLGSSLEKKVDLEIVSGDVALKKDIQDSTKPVQHAQDSRMTVQAAPVGTYDLSAPEIIPSYSIMSSNPGKTSFCLQ